MGGRKEAVDAINASRCNCTALRKATRRISSFMTRRCAKRPQDHAARDPRATRPVRTGHCRPIGRGAGDGRRRACAYAQAAGARRLVAVTVDSEDSRNRLIS